MLHLCCLKIGIVLFFCADFQLIALLFCVGDRSDKCIRNQGRIEQTSRHSSRSTKTALDRSTFDRWVFKNFRHSSIDSYICWKRHNKFTFYKERRSDGFKMKMKTTFKIKWYQVFTDCNIVSSEMPLTTPSTYSFHRAAA